MAFFPHVNKGDTFQPDSVLENNIRDCVNAFNGYGARPMTGVKGNSVRIAVWNASGEALPAGAAVSIEPDGNENEAGGSALPCQPYDGDNRVWGILANALPENAVGDCIIGGVARVSLAGGGNPGDRVMPVILENGKVQKFAAVPCGDARLLFADGDNSVILLDREDGYHGYFKVVLAKTTGEPPEEEDDSSSSSSSSSSDDSSSGGDEWPGGSGILGLSGGKLVLYPTGSCDDDDDGDDSGDDDSSDEDSSDDDSSSSGSSSSSSSSGGSSSSGSSSSEESSSAEESSSGTEGGDGSETVLAVVDGADPNSWSCGFIDMGTTRISVPRCTFADWKRKTDLYVYLQTGGNGIGVYLSSSYPSPAGKKFRRLLGRLVYRNGAYSVVQEQHGPVIENYQMMVGGLEAGNGR